MAGRWPPNILLSEEAAAEMDRQSGSLKSGSNNFINRSSADHLGNTSPAYGAESRPAGQQMISYGDTGGASRFFPQFNWDPEYDAPFMYCAKAPPKERPKVDGIAHPTCKPLALMRWLVRLVTPPGRNRALTRSAGPAPRPRPASWKASGMFSLNGKQITSS